MSHQKRPFFCDAIAFMAQGDEESNVERDGHQAKQCYEHRHRRLNLMPVLPMNILHRFIYSTPRCIRFA